ncbi:hypothetical protein H2198_009839 [Neophaeococcomyces mojaviensis]|uniref:Uncharacterized protein n=1 Tax=Neophaeococcomyces mojaviensis TaxID=3383035 RepID=A0ACC2ZTB2_9EURO|nr:hypothetical protein H2198_009839 [Knufia sp. JES_112]
MSSSHQLPVFGIRHLSGPRHPPGLVSITRGEYDGTVYSEPAAKLLYLDDDDGELITVGSALELSQRLEEPVPRYVRNDVQETRNPLDGRLVHVFDINHTPGSLAVWRDHEAYSSKTLRRSPSPKLKSPFDDPVEEVDGRSLADILAPSEAVEGTVEHSAREVEPSGTKEEPGQRDPANEQAVKILDTIETHLSGLANVLQVAATTLQKAADKTRDTDSSVVEDILKGVKGILTEVGSFGLEAYNAFEAEVNSNDTSSESWAIASETKPEPVDSVQEKTPSETTVSEPEDLALDEDERAPSHPTEFEDARSSPRVKFAASLDDVADEPCRPAESPVSSPSIVAGESFSDKRKRDEMGEIDRANPQPVGNSSILDDGNEDADFTARYPPLMSVRRAHTVNGLLGRETRRGLRKLDRHGQLHENAFTCRPKSVDHQDASDPAPKRVPGAWPDVKNDSTAALPVSGESSGAFFNRMMGRDGSGDSSFFEKGHFGLHRANTTAASNPASRLNGPFDPGFPYQPSDATAADGYHKAPFRPRRPFGSSSRARLYQPPWARSARDESSPVGFNAWRDYIKEDTKQELKSKRSMPAMHFDPPPGFNVESKVSASSTPTNKPDGFSKYESHRGVKHYRSVPQFHVSPQLSTNVTDSYSPPGPSRVPDLLTGSIAPYPVSSSLFPPPPTAPFTAKAVTIPEARPLMHPAPSPPRPIVSPVNLNQATQSAPAPVTHPAPISPSFANHLYNTSKNSSQTSLFTAPPQQPVASSATYQPQPQPQPRPYSLANFHPPSAFTAYSPPFRLQQPVPQQNQQSAPPAPPLSKHKFDQCVEQLQTLGFGINDKALGDRLHVYAVAADGDVNEAVEMIEEDRRCSERTFH